MRNIPKCDTMFDLIHRCGVDPAKPVEVYRNLHKNCYSVKQGGLVRAHMDVVRLYDCTFKVNQRGRQRVVETGRKNVHARVCGYVSATANRNPNSVPNRIFYNPYKWNGFMQEFVRATGTTYRVVQHKALVWLSQSGVFAS